MDDLLWYQGKVIGVKARGDYGELYSDVVIVADGVNSMLAEKAGLRKPYAPRQVSLGMKEIIELPRSVIEDRFNLEGNEGVELKYIAGDATKGIWGGGNIYTNLEISFSGNLGSLGPAGKKQYKSRRIVRAVQRTIPSSEIISRAGRPSNTRPIWRRMADMISRPKYFTNGLMIAGDAARFLNASIHYEGTNFAMASGEAAAKTVLEAERNNDYSERNPCPITRSF